MKLFNFCYNKNFSVGNYDEKFHIIILINGIYTKFDKA